MAAGIPGLGLPGMMPGAAPGAAPGAGPGGAPNPLAGVMALVGKALSSNKAAGGTLDVKSLEDAMATVQMNASRAMKSNPKAYQSLLRALQALHAAVTDIKQSPQSGPPLTSSMMDLVAPQNSMVNPTGG